jgi:hypothetical protein
MEKNRNYADECGDHGGTNRDGDPCGRAAGWGRDADSGKCRIHAGTSPDGSSHKGNQNAVGNDGGAPEGNANAITHGATADPVNLYEHLDEDSKAWVDKLVAGYLDEAAFGEDSPKAERLRMTCVIIYQEWSAREVVLRDGPSEDIVVGVSEDGAPIARSDEHHLTGTAASHNQTVRMNLKDLGLLDDPESQKANAAEGIISILSKEANSER